MAKEQQMIESFGDGAPETPSDEWAKDDAARSSKEKFQRLSPIFENAINQLQINFDGFVVPENFLHNLAEGWSITQRGDIFSTELLLTITKLRPLITKKLGITWTDLKAALNKIIKRNTEADDRHFDTLETIPDTEWFYETDGVPHSDYMDVALAIRRLPSCY